MISQKSRNFVPEVFYTLNDLPHQCFQCESYSINSDTAQLWGCWVFLGFLGPPQDSGTSPVSWSEMDKTNVFNRLRGLSGVSLVECLLCVSCRTIESSSLGILYWLLLILKTLELLYIFFSPANCTGKSVLLILSNGYFWMCLKPEWRCKKFDLFNHLPLLKECSKVVHCFPCWACCHVIKAHGIKQKSSCSNPSFGVGWTKNLRYFFVNLTVS